MRYIDVDDKGRLDVLRRRAKRMGYRIAKSRWRHHTIDNWGGLMIIENYQNLVVAGDRFSLTVDAAEEWLDTKGSS